MIALLILLITTQNCYSCDIKKDTRAKFCTSHKLVEPSQKILEIGEEALRNCGLYANTIVLEDPTPNAPYEGYTLQANPVSALVLCSLRNNSEEETNSKRFIAYHECGHLFYKHNALRNFVEHHTKSNTPYSGRFAQPQTIQPINNRFRLDQEKEADLFACEHLIKSGHVDTLMQAIISPHAPDNGAVEGALQANKNDPHPQAKEVTRYLQACLNSKIRPDKNTLTKALRYAVTFNNREAMRQLIAQGAEAHSANDKGFTALHRAAENNDTDLASILLKVHAPIEARDHLGMTPLMWAIEFKTEPMVRFLLQRKANPNVKDDKGFAALHLAIEKSTPAIVNLLLRHGADPNVRDPKGLTARDWGRASKNSAIQALFK